MKEEKLIGIIKEIKKLYDDYKMDDLEFVLNTVLKEIEKEEKGE